MNNRIFDRGGKSLLLALLMTSRALPVSADDSVPRHAGAHVLSNGVLTVEVMDPNDPNRYNSGNRFSSLGNVLRAVKDGKDYFFSPVPHDPVMENCGLPNEFDIATDENPPGFAAAKIGDPFLKIGVGLLRKLEPDYFFWKTNETMVAATTTAKWAKDSADFEQTCPATNGYSYKTGATVQLRDSTIILHYTLTNTGTHPFVTEQYTHNFFLFGGAPVGPNYQVDFPYDIQPTGLDAMERQQGRSVLYTATLPGAVNIRVPIAAGYSGPNSVTVRNTANGQQIVVTTTIPGTRTFLHATKNYLCPEQFVRLSLDPGQTVDWERHYELSCRP